MTKDKVCHFDFHMKNIGITSKNELKLIDLDFV